jgi:hypothetical protein
VVEALAPDVAAHESGHLQVAQMLGIDITSAMIRPDGSGETVCVNLAERSWFDVAALYLAGAWAAALHDPSSPHARLRGFDAIVVASAPGDVVQAARRWLDGLAARADVLANLEMTAWRLLAHGMVMFEE